MSNASDNRCLDTGWAKNVTVAQDAELHITNLTDCRRIDLRLSDRFIDHFLQDAKSAYTAMKDKVQNNSVESEINVFKVLNIIILVRLVPMNLESNADNFRKARIVYLHTLSEMIILLAFVNKKATIYNSVQMTTLLATKKLLKMIKSRSTNSF